MSDVQPGHRPPVGIVPPPKKGNKIWIFAGVGCLLVSLLCLGGLGIVGYVGYGVYGEMEGAKDSIANSQAVQAELGSPIEVGIQSQAPQGQEVILKGSVKGPKGSGTYRITLVRESSTSLSTKEITVDANGKTIVVGDELSEIEEELGDLEELNLGDGQ